MNIDDLPLLMAVFWQGFSLPYIILVWFQRLRPQWDPSYPNVSTSVPRPVPYLGRLALSILGICGALGAAALTATLRHHVGGISAAFLVGFAVGMLAAYLLHIRALSNSNGSGNESV